MISRTAKLALTLTGGAAAVAAFVQSRRAQSEKKPAYLVAEVEVTDPVAFQVYLNKAMETLKLYNVRVISNSKPDVKEGAPAQGHIIILGFNSLANAQKWYESSPYKELISECQKAANTRVYFVEGLPRMLRRRKNDAGPTLALDAALRIVTDAFRWVVLRDPTEADMAEWQGRIARDPSQIGTLIGCLLTSDELSYKARAFAHKYFQPDKVQFITDESQNGEVKILLRDMVSNSVECQYLVDVGAFGRTGSNSFDLLKHFGRTGLLVEPNPEQVAIIQREFAGLDIKIVEVAAADYSGQGTLHLGVDAQIASLYQASTGSFGPITGEHSVRVETLPAILRDNNVPKEFGLLSLDSEGNGITLLNDAVSAGYRPDYVILEVGAWRGNLPELPGLLPNVAELYGVIGQTAPNIILRRRKMMEFAAAEALSANAD